jgi:pimeloyl-ACP methyl ester carboxylesterase
VKKILPYNAHESLSYAEYGNPTGFPILIHHGLIASITGAALFHSLMALGARLICLARPGYGDSSPYLLPNIGAWADIVNPLIDALQLSQFDILGMSSGTPYSYALAYHFPQKVRNVYVFSGTPALYDAQVQALWPFPITHNASLPDLQKLAHDLFFSNLSPADQENADIQDSLRNNCFGPALDLKIRVDDWGFTLADVTAKVYMQHSRTDDSVPYSTARRTSQLLPNCTLLTRESGEHFSPAALDGFITTTLAPFYKASFT